MVRIDHGHLSLHRFWEGMSLTLAIATLGCRDGTGLDPIEIALEFCSSSRPVFAAIQVDGNTWTPIEVEDDGTVRFRAPERLGVAFAIPGLQSFGTTQPPHITYVYYVTSAELQPLSGAPCPPPGSLSKSVNGTVTGVPAGSSAYVTFGPFAQLVNPANGSTFNFTPLPDGPLDLVAQRESGTGNQLVPDAVIVRRGVNQPHNSTMLPLNFGNVEAHPIIGNTLSVGGLGAGETAAFSLTWRTAGGAAHRVLPTMSLGNGLRPIYAVPSALAQTGDIHALALSVSVQSATSIRGTAIYYGEPGDQAITIGPPLSTPIVTPLVAAPKTLLRAELPAQEAYASFAFASMLQAPPPASGFSGQTGFVIVKTAAFSGGLPGTWTLDVPDLTAVDGFPDNAGLNPNTFTRVQIGAQSGPVSLYLGARPRDGMRTDHATRTSTFTTPTS